jgi:hypothetical protein
MNREQRRRLRRERGWEYMPRVLDLVVALLDARGPGLSELDVVPAPHLPPAGWRPMHVPTRPCAAG